MWEIVSKAEGTPNTMFILGLLWVEILFETSDEICPIKFTNQERQMQMVSYVIIVIKVSRFNLKKFNYSVPLLLHCTAAGGVIDSRCGISH